MKRMPHLFLTPFLFQRSRRLPCLGRCNPCSIFLLQGFCDSCAAALVFALFLMCYVFACCFIPHSLFLHVWIDGKPVVADRNLVRAPPYPAPNHKPIELYNTSVIPKTLLHMCCFIRALTERAGALQHEGTASEGRVLARQGQGGACRAQMKMISHAEAVQALCACCKNELYVSKSPLLILDILCSCPAATHVQFMAVCELPP
jgi:hypothetical protein